MDMRYEMRGDGRRLPPRNSRGEFRRRRSRRDRGMMDYGDMRRSDYAMEDMRRGGMGIDYENRTSNMDMRGNYRNGGMGDLARRDYGYDGHYGMHSGRAGGYEPVEFMGYCSGYAGAKQDYARGDMNYREYDMRGRDYGYPMYDMRGGRDYGYDDYGYPVGDFGQTLTDQELEAWDKRLLGQLDEREKQMFSKDAIMQKIKQMGLKMEGFGEKELYTNTLANYTDHKKSIGQNPDLAIKLAYDWLCDDDVAVKGAEKLAVYYDCIVMGEDD